MNNGDLTFYDKILQWLKEHKTIAILMVVFGVVFSLLQFVDLFNNVFQEEENPCEEIINHVEIIEDKYLSDRKYTGFIMDSDKFFNEINQIKDNPKFIACLKGEKRIIIRIERKIVDLAEYQLERIISKLEQGKSIEKEELEFESLLKLEQDICSVYGVCNSEKMRTIRESYELINSEL